MKILLIGFLVLSSVSSFAGQYSNVHCEMRGIFVNQRKLNKSPTQIKESRRLSSQVCKIDFEYDQASSNSEIKTCKFKTGIFKYMNIDFQIETRDIAHQPGSWMLLSINGEKINEEYLTPESEYNFMNSTINADLKNSEGDKFVMHDYNYYCSWNYNP